MRTLFVSGYGKSGSSYLIDTLLQSDCFYDLGFEFRLFRDPYGLLALDQALTNNHNARVVSEAVDKYLWLIDKLYRKTSFTLYGRNYQRAFGDSFLKENQNFINSIVEFKFEDHWYFNNFKKPPLQVAFEQVLVKIANKVKINIVFHKTKNTVYVCKKNSKDDFAILAKNFLSNLFYNVQIKESSSKYCVLNNCITNNDSLRALDYFDNPKLILVDRDPRDIFVEWSSRRRLFLSKPTNNLTAEDIANFISFFKLQRNNQAIFTKDKRVLKIQFEELVHSYSETIGLISGFTNVGLKEIKALDTNKKLTGLYRNYPNQEHIKLIEQELQKHCVL